ncbi:uncharacterized protein LOC125012023 [Mugil cephalus]|uniref:uncharacterized protein LOC125012023 n=1 Tax=Mugil cephalus TaxID=48193 RepID=UPI001FB6A176|nr:uncharacterized protein LOC125012023 [Mugil cephalus]
MASKTSTAMHQTKSPLEEETPPPTVDVIHHVVDYYFGILEPKQWAFLLTGNPDDKTRYLLAELVMELMDLMPITPSTLAEEEERRRAVKPWENLSSCLGALPQTFPQTLVVPDEVFREVLASFRNILIRAAAAACVTSMLFASTHPKPYAQYGTAFLNLVERMVGRAVKMLCREKRRLLHQHQRLHLNLSVVTSTPRLPEGEQEDVESRRSGDCNKRP